MKTMGRVVGGVVESGFLRSVSRVGAVSIALLVALSSAGPFVGSASAEGRNRGAGEGVEKPRPNATAPGASRRSVGRERASEVGVRAAERASRGEREAAEKAALPGALPAPAQAPIPAPAAGGAAGMPGAVDPEVEAAKARVAEMQALSEAHVQELSRGSEAFVTRIQAAKTPAERAAVQEELKRFQTEKNAEFQRRMMELKSRR